MFVLEGPLYQVLTLCVADDSRYIHLIDDTDLKKNLCFNFHKPFFRDRLRLSRDTPFI